MRAYAVCHKMIRLTLEASWFPTKGTIDLSSPDSVHGDGMIEMKTDRMF